MANLKTIKREEFVKNFEFNNYKFNDKIIVNMCEKIEGKKIWYEINVIQYIESPEHLKTNIDTVYKSELYFRTINAFNQLIDVLKGVNYG